MSNYAKPQSYHHNYTWNDLYLLLPEEFNALPEGAVVSSIKGGKFVKGTDEFDLSLHEGYTIYGLYLHQIRT